MLTLKQRVYLIQCYGIGEVSYQRAIELFHLRFPEVQISVNGLKKLKRKFEDSGSVVTIQKKKKKLNEDDAATLLALNSVQTNPRLSLNKRAAELGIVSKSHLHRIFKENKIHPYKPLIVHKLEYGDESKRLEFCLLLGEKMIEDRNFHRKIMFSDESTFTTNGVMSTQNYRHWASENPNFVVESRSQRYRNVNVWCGMLYNRIIGPYFIEGPFNQHSYLELLRTFMLQELGDEVEEIYFQQDGCPAHSTANIRNFLNVHFQNRWIGRYGPIPWPARSPDLTPMDFFLWGYLKQKVYESDLHDDQNVLKQRIRAAIQGIKIESIRATYDQFKKRIEKCADLGGTRIEGAN